LSCGGPIIFPDSGNFLITPVAPHNLNVRPIVISDSKTLSFEIEGRASHFLATLDSRSKTVTSDHSIKVQKCDFSAQLIQLEGESFMTTLRNKMAWGKDVRN
jgi:NAD+ kinase